MEQTQAQFEGWAIVEMFGHNKTAGFVTTQNFGQACLFRVDTPELPDRDVKMTRPGSLGGEWIEAGATVRRPAEPARSKLIGPGAVYAINPCTEEAVREYLESSRTLPLIVLDRPKRAELPAADADNGDDDCPDCSLLGHTCDDCRAIQREADEAEREFADL